MFNDDTQDVITSTNDNEDTTVEETTEDTSTEGTTTDWEAEAKKWKAIAERKAKKAVQAPKTETNLSSPDIERLTLKVDGYNDDEIAEVMKLGGVKALSNPLVKKAIEAMREERQAESAQVTESGARSDISRKYSPADLRKMSSSELEKILS